jgi:hypothetical protein
MKILGDARNKDIFIIKDGAYNLSRKLVFIGKRKHNE